jgi:hypothetical protein
MWKLGWLRSWFPKSVEMVHEWLTPLDVTEPTLPWYSRAEYLLAGRSLDQAANQRLPASCMDLLQFQTMERVCTLWHRAAGVGMRLFYMQCMSCCQLLLVTFSFRLVSFNIRHYNGLGSCIHPVRGAKNKNREEER